MPPLLDGRMLIAVVIGILALTGYALTSDPTTPLWSPPADGSDGTGTEPVACHTTGCSNQLCVPAGEDRVTTCEWKPEYGCLKDCRARNGTCGFDPVFRQSCMECLDQCRSQDKGGDCFQTCYSQ